jgi:hypothetical protein
VREEKERTFVLARQAKGVEQATGPADSVQEPILCLRLQFLDALPDPRQFIAGKVRGERPAGEKRCQGNYRDYLALHEGEACQDTGLRSTSPLARGRVRSKMSVRKFVERGSAASGIVIDESSVQRQGFKA